MSLHVLSTVYNEASFFSYAMRSCLPYVDHVTCVEGAYLETIKLGQERRSTDGTVSMAKSFVSPKFDLIFANEKSDTQQRNVGLENIKKVDPNAWLLLIDGDEIHPSINFKMISALTKKMDLCGAKAAYMKSLTFVNDFQSYCLQSFPRLFKLTPDCSFFSDNYMRWGTDANFSLPNVIQAPNISFYHYSFCKGKERFSLKKNWWESRFEKPFHYSWSTQDDGTITDQNHKIMPFSGRHPEIMKSHPLYPKGDLHV